MQFTWHLQIKFSISSRICTLSGIVMTACVDVCLINIFDQ